VVLIAIMVVVYGRRRNAAVLEKIGSGDWRRLLAEWLRRASLFQPMQSMPHTSMLAI